MPTGNKHPYPLVIVMGTLLCLAALSLVQNGLSIGGHTLRRLDILADLRQPEPAADTAFVAQEITIPADSTADSVAVAVRRDFLTYSGILDYGITAEGESGGMQYFMQALKALRTGQRKKVRIAYFGDSMIEGDLITQDLRDSLQAYFGGEGVGYVPATSVVSGFRTSIGHTYSGNWTDYHFMNTPPGGTELGISGHVFVPSADSWVRYTPVKRQRLDQFEEVSLLYGSGGRTVMVNNKPLQLGGNRKINAYSFTTDSTARALTLKFNGHEQTPFYGVCFESRHGIFLDNYSFRGISGIELARLSSGMWRQMRSVRPYDLIVLHYGANVLYSPENTKYDWYGKTMVRVVDSLHRIFPQTSILIVGTADKSYRKQGKYVTAPGVKALLKVQHRVAEKRGIAYWNLYSAMGGDGAMAKWVEGDTALANKDYTHFNFRGASKVGALLYKAIMDEYQQETF